MPNTGKGVLVLYTGGTVGMRQGPQGLVPASVDEVFGQLPASLLSGQNAPTWRSLENPLDSSDLQPEHWQQMAGILAESYEQFEGFVVLHGTDTMAYTASALSFMLQGLSKPVVLTGSQLPLGHRRTDAVHHLNSALEFAMAQKDNGEPRLQEVCLYFHNKVYRGNRCRKNQASGFDAFESPNYPALATAGTALRFDEQAMDQGLPTSPLRSLCYRPALDSSIASLRMFPGLNPSLVHGITEQTGSVFCCWKAMELAIFLLHRPWWKPCGLLLSKEDEWLPLANAWAALWIWKGTVAVVNCWTWAPYREGISPSKRPSPNPCTFWRIQAALQGIRTMTLQSALAKAWPEKLASAPRTTPTTHKPGQIRFAVHLSDFLEVVA